MAPMRRPRRVQPNTNVCMQPLLRTLCQRSCEVIEGGERSDQSTSIRVLWCRPWQMKVVAAFGEWKLPVATWVMVLYTAHSLVLQTRTSSVQQQVQTS